MKKYISILLSFMLISTLFGCTSADKAEDYIDNEMSPTFNSNDEVTYDSMNVGMVLSLDQIKNATQGIEDYRIYAVKLAQDQFQIVNIGGTSWRMNNEAPDFFFCDKLTSLYRDDCLVEFSSGNPSSHIQYILYQNQWIAPFFLGSCTDGSYAVEPFPTKEIIEKTFVSGDIISADEMYDYYTLDNISTLNGDMLDFQDLIEFDEYYLMDVYPNQHIYMGYFVGTEYFEGEYSTAALIQIDREGEYYYSGEVGEPTRDGYYIIGNIEDIISYYPETDNLYVSLSGGFVNNISLWIHCNENRDSNTL